MTTLYFTDTENSIEVTLTPTAEGWRLTAVPCPFLGEDDETTQVVNPDDQFYIGQWECHYLGSNQFEYPPCPKFTDQVSSVKTNQTGVVKPRRSLKRGRDIR